LRKALITSVMVFSLVGCSQTQLLYNNATFFIESKFGGYLDQTPEEKKFFKKKIKNFINWHRSSMLLTYAEYLDEQIGLLKSKSFGSKQVSVSINGLRQLVKKTIEGGAPFVAEVLAKQTAQSKLLFLESRLKEDSERDVEKQISIVEEQKVRRRRVEKNLKSFLGYLNQAQYTIVDYYISSTEKHPSHWVKKNKERRQKLITFLKKQPKVDKIKIYLGEIFFERQVDPMVKEWWYHFEGLTSGVFTSLEEKQVKKLIEVLSGYSSDFRALAEQD